VKPTLVIQLKSRVPTAYSNVSLDLDLVIDDSDDYRHGLTELPAYFIEPKVSPAEVKPASEIALAAEKGLLPKLA
jgi:hypothetical protein